MLLEYDRTRRASKQRDRWRRYDRFLAETWRDSRFASGRAPVAVYVVNRDRQLSSFLREADRHLTAWVGPREGVPSQGTYPGRDLLLFTSRERIHAGVWDMERLPSQPVNVRGSSAVHPRSAPFPIFALFRTQGAESPANA